MNTRYVRLGKGLLISATLSYIYSADATAAPGTALTPEIPVAAITPRSTNPRSNIAAVGRDAAGNFAVAYTTGVAAPGLLEHRLVYVQRFLADGTANGAPTLVFDNAPGVRVALAMDDLGDFVVAGVGQSAPTAAGIIARAYAADGSPRGPAFVVSDGSDAPVGFRKAQGFDMFDPAIAMNAGSGDFAVAWQGHAENVVIAYPLILTLYSAGYVQVRAYDAAGNPKGDSATVTVESTRQPCGGGANGSLGHPIVATTPTDGYVVAWHSNLGDCPPLVNARGLVSPFKLRLYGANGHAQSATQELPIVDTISGTTDPGTNDMALAVGPAGDVYLAWSSLSLSASGTHDDERVFLRRFTANGAASGASMLVAVRTQTNFSGKPDYNDGVGSGLSVSGTSSGAVVSWADDADDSVNGRYYVNGSGTAELMTQGAPFLIGSYADQVGTFRGDQGWLANLSSVTTVEDNLIAVWDQLKARLFMGH